MKVFISHARNDAELALAVSERLSDLGHTAIRGATAEPGTSLIDQLETCSAMIALLRPTSYRSHWVKKEIEFGLSHSRFRKRFLPVFVGKGFADASVSIPWILKLLEPLKLSRSQAPKRNATHIVREFERRLGRRGRV